MTRPYVTITVPTYNSEKFIELCLQSVLNQSYKQIEINVVDKGSKDKTLDIIKRLGIAQITSFTGPLLGARHKGVSAARGKYVLLLDSDQVLSKGAVGQSVELMETGKYDMVVLEEGSYKPKTWIEKLHELDKKLMHEIMDLSPYTGVILARFYKRTTLRRAFGNIPPKMLRGLGGQDHAIIYYEAWRLGKRFGVVPQAVNHIEPDSISEVCRKAYRWGYTSVSAHYSKYKKLIQDKERLRTGLFKKGLIIESIASILVLLMKGIPFKLGYFAGKIDRNLELFANRLRNIDQ